MEEDYMIKSCQEYYPYAANTIADWGDICNPSHLRGI